MTACILTGKLTRNSCIVYKLFQALKSGIREVKSSKKLRKLLELILAIGNYINGEGRRGGTWGFKLDTFEKLERHKAQSDGKTTLLQYMVLHLEKTDPGLINVSYMVFCCYCCT